MSSTQVVVRDNTHRPQVQLNNIAANSRSLQQDPASCTTQPPAPPPAPTTVAVGTTAPPPGPCLNDTTAAAAAAVDNKRFTTAYGMVVWPALPGLSAAATDTTTPTRRIPDTSLSEGAARAATQTTVPRAKEAAASGPSSNHSNEPLVSSRACAIMMVFWAVEWNGVAARRVFHRICTYSSTINNVV